MYEENPEWAAYPPRRPIAWVTWILVGSTVAIFLLQLLFVHLTGDDGVGDELAFSLAAFTQHHYWTLLTYAWVHAVVLFGEPDLFWLHIVANMIPLVCLGPALEEFLGHGRFLVLYLGGAIASVLVWLLFNLNADPTQPIAGASGAIFALIAAVGTAAPRGRVVVYLFFILPIRMSLRTLALTICGMELAQLIFGWMPGIAHEAHLGGAAFGFLYILAIRWISGRSSFQV